MMHTNVCEIATSERSSLSFLLVARAPPALPTTKAKFRSIHLNNRIHNCLDSSFRSQLLLGTQGAFCWRHFTRFRSRINGKPRWRQITQRVLEEMHLQHGISHV